jgi:hypothetical protein
MDTFLTNILRTPLSADDIEKRRSEVLKSAKVVDNDEYCQVSVETARNVIKSINREFFNNLLELPKVKKGYLPENPGILAVHIPPHNTTYINCKAITETSRFLHKFANIKIKDQNLDLNVNILRMVTYVLEHELCHLALTKYRPDLSKEEVSHGHTFRTLVSNLFGHGWGDFAFVHIQEYIGSGFRKKKFFELLSTPPGNFDDEYREEVYTRLFNATTMSNAYRIFTSPRQGGGTRRKLTTHRTRRLKSRY